MSARLTSVLRWSALVVLLCVSTGCAVPRSSISNVPTSHPTSEALSLVSPTRQPTRQPTTTVTAAATATTVVARHPPRAPAREPPPIKETGMITFTIIYDNNAHDPALTPQWGFACLIERADLTLLFDTGGNGSTLMANMAALDKDPADVDLIMLSHEHGDHTGGLARFLETSAQAGSQPADPPRPREGHIPEVVVPTVFASSFKAQIRERTSLVEVSEPLNVRPGLWSTGEVKGPVAEQAAVVQTRKGWVVVTGCAHPGVEAITARALEVTGGPIALVVGGYHLHNAGTSRIAETIEALRGMDVAAVAPTHCTGDKARAMFAEAYGDAYYEAGAGFTLQLETQP